MPKLPINLALVKEFGLVGVFGSTNLWLYMWQ